MNLAPEEGESGRYPLSRRSHYVAEKRVVDFWGPEDHKWSSDEEDLADLSERFPGKLFELTASGCPDDDCVIYAKDEPDVVWGGGWIVSATRERAGDVAVKEHA